MAWSATISWIVLRPLIASMATLALNSGLWGGACSTPSEKASPTVGAPFRGGAPPQRLTMGAVQKSQTTSLIAAMKQRLSGDGENWRAKSGCRLTACYKRTTDHCITELNCSLSPGAWLISSCRAGRFYQESQLIGTSKDHQVT
jgi:hypothetical protein